MRESNLQHPQSEEAGAGGAGPEPRTHSSGAGLPGHPGPEQRGAGGEFGSPCRGAAGRLAPLPGRREGKVVGSVQQPSGGSGDSGGGAGARVAGLWQAMVPPRHSAPLHRAHHLILPQCDPAGPEGAREGRQTGGAR